VALKRRKTPVKLVYFKYNERRRITKTTSICLGVLAECAQESGKIKKI